MRRFKTIGLCLTVVFVLGAIVASAASASGGYGTCTSESGHAAEGPCAVNEKFSPFSESGEMVVSHSTTSFLLLSETKPAKGIECKTLSDMGVFKNVGNVGESEDELDFQSCTPINLSGCTEINPKTSHEILGKILDEVSKEGTEVMLTVEPNQLNVKCIIAGEEVELGGVTGLTNGKVKGDKLEFSKSTGLTFFANKSTITGTDLTETLGKAPVFVCVG